MLLYCYAVTVRVVTEDEKGYYLPSSFAVMAVRKEFGRGKRMIVRGLLMQAIVAFSFVLFDFH